MQTTPVPFRSREAAQLLGMAPSAAEQDSSGTAHEPGGEGETAFQRDCHSVEAGIVQGFQLATAAGPLCDEPMWGLVFQVRHLGSRKLQALLAMLACLSRPFVGWKRQILELTGWPCVLAACSVCPDWCNAVAVCRLHHAERKHGNSPSL